MMNATFWNATAQEIDRAESLWFDGGERANPRLLTFELERPQDEPRFLNVTQSGGRTFLTLTVLEPFRNLPVECPGCFLDELNLTWPAAGPGGSFVFVGVTVQGGSPDALVDPGLRFARYRSRTFEETPDLWRLVLEIV
jgi:hypothetical protein